MLKYKSLIFYLVLFSFFGWLLEFAYTGTPQDSMLVGNCVPLIPIYGFAAVIIYILESKYGDLNIWKRVILYTIVITIIELVSGYAAEKIYGKKQWDYSNDSKYHIDGHIDVKHTVYWMLIVATFLFFKKGFE